MKRLCFFIMLLSGQFVGQAQTPVYNPIIHAPDKYIPQSQIQPSSIAPSQFTPQNVNTQTNPSSALNQQQKQQEENSAVLNEARNSATTREYWTSPEFAKATKPYYDAFNRLEDQLTGKSRVSIKDAYYAIESAYGNVYCTKEEFDAYVQKCTFFIKRWMAEHKFNPNDNISKHLALQKFISDTLHIGSNNSKTSELHLLSETHYPFYYDYQDYKVDKKQIVAQAMLDLATEYREQFGIADGKFINQCVDFAINYFPNKNASVDCWLLKSEVTRVQLNRLARKYKVTSYLEGDKIPEIKALEDTLGFIDYTLENLGYTEIPTTAYDFMVENQDSKGNIQKLKQMNNLAKRNSFISTTQ